MKVLMRELMRKSYAPSPRPKIDTGEKFLNDQDRDGFQDHVEGNIGTNPNQACGENAWPPDFNNNKKVEVDDIILIAEKVGLEYPAPSYERYDFD